MKLIGASILDKVDSFLHAGYISAHPRHAEAYTYPSDVAEVELQIDMVEALELSTSSPEAGDILDASVAVVSGGGGGSHMLLLGALTLTGIAALLFLMRRMRLASSLRLAPVLSAVCLWMTVLLTPNCAEDPEFDDVNDNDEEGGGTANDDAQDSSLDEEDVSTTEEEELPTDPPWEGVERKQYADPELATLAILHGIVAPAVATFGEPISDLANVQDIVSLPTSELSEGMAYALSTYGIDGYGNPFKFETREIDYGTENVITSAGADGEFGTDDDIAHAFEEKDEGSWDWQQVAYYLIENDGEVELLFHIWHGELFEYADQELAKDITGCDNFDVIPRAQLQEDQLAQLDSSYESVAKELSHNPLVLQVI